MPEQAYAHFRAAERLDPQNAEIQKRLRRKLVNGTWIDEKEVAEAKKEAERLALRIKAWREKIKPLIENLDKGRPNAFEELERAIVGTTDHAIVPVLEENIFKRGERVANLGIRVLRTIPHQDAVYQLIRSALYLPWDSTKSQCIAEFRHRRPNDFVPSLILASDVDERIMPTGPGMFRTIRVDSNVTRYMRVRFTTYTASVSQSREFVPGGYVVYEYEHLAPGPHYGLANTNAVQYSDFIRLRLDEIKRKTLAQPLDSTILFLVQVPTNLPSVQEFRLTRRRTAFNLLNELYGIDFEFDTNRLFAWYFQAFDPIARFHQSLLWTRLLLGIRTRNRDEFRSSPLILVSSLLLLRGHPNLHRTRPSADQGYRSG